MDPKNTIKNTKSFHVTLQIIIGGTFFLIVGLLSGFYLGKTLSNQNIPDRKKPFPTKSKEVSCTQDAKLCPDGLSVGRISPNCEFAPCPTAIIKEENDWKTYKTSKYEMLYPSSWTVQESCTAMMSIYYKDKPCLSSSDFKRIKTGEIIQEGDIEVEKTLSGMLIFVSLYKDDYPVYSPSLFCRPGGPDIIYECKEKTINKKMFPMKEIGLGEYNIDNIDNKEAYILDQNKIKASIVIFFTKENKEAAYSIFDKVLESFTLK